MTESLRIQAYNHSGYKKRMIGLLDVRGYKNEDTQDMKSANNNNGLKTYGIP